MLCIIRLLAEDLGEDFLDAADGLFCAMFKGPGLEDGLRLGKHLMFDLKVGLYMCVSREEKVCELNN